MTTSYFLAVDVGTSRTAAATVRIAADDSIVAAPFPLGRQSDSAPTVVFVGEGELLYGDAAARRGISQPERLVREFKRRIGDDVPLLAGGRRFSPEQLYALVVEWVIDTVAEREGRRPSGVAVTVPVTWGEYRTDLISAALARTGWNDVMLIAEPEAAARHYESDAPLRPGQLLAVYDLGGGTFDAVLLRKRADGVEVVGDPAGLDSYGGSDFDDLVLRYAIDAAGLSVDELAADTDARIALGALRREAVEAKEALSFDAETVIPVLAGGRRTTVRLTRSEFEGMIEDGIVRTVDVVSDVFASAGIQADEVQAVLLTGGSSRIPRIAQLLSERFDRPVAVDADPKAVISLGAARAVAERRRAVAVVPDEAIAPAASDDEGTAAAFVRKEPLRRRFGRGPAIAAVAAGALVLAGGIAFATISPLNGAARDDIGTSQSPTPRPTTSDPAPTSTTGSSPTGPGSTIEPTASMTPADPLLTPAPPGVVVDLFPQPEPTESGR